MPRRQKARRPDVVFVSWRDLSHPESGGSERYVHAVAEGLAADGLEVRIVCAAHGAAPADDVVRGVHVRRRGGRYGVYARALLHVALARPRLVVDVQNGVPFASTLVRRGPVIVLVHHVHREQWPIVFGRFLGALGWWVESRLAPAVYRRCRYVTVSRSTAEELGGLGVDRERITMVPNGAVPLVEPSPGPAATPHVVVLGRLVPHKRVEHALDAVARLRTRYPTLTLDVVGDGYWRDELDDFAARRGLGRTVRFHGHVDEETKHRLLGRAWVHVLPTVKEGWGLTVSEAGQHAVPTVAYRDAGGVCESVLDGETGVLVDDWNQLVETLAELLAVPARRVRLGRAAQVHASTLDWESSRRRFAALTVAALGGGPRGSAVPVLDRQPGGPRGLAGAVEDGHEGEHGRCTEDQPEESGQDRTPTCGHERDRLSLGHR